MSDELTELPEGWVHTTIGNVVECLDSKRSPVNKDERAKRLGRIPYYGANGLVGWIDDYLFDEPLVLVVEDETFTGREKPFSYKIEGKSWVNNHAHVLRSTTAIDLDYLNYSLQYYPFTPLTTGTTGRRKLTQKSLLAAPYILPPLNEQKRIVAKIEELRDRSHRAKQALEAIPELCDRFRQSVLAAAFRGDLTADWREENPDVEPASVLLERIRGDRSNNPTKRKVSIESLDSSSLPEIPETWEWEKLISISNLLGGVTKGRKFNGQLTMQVPYLRVANVQDGFLDLGEVKEIEVLPGDIEKYRLEYGDILFTEGGDRDKLGRGTVWQNEIEGCIHQNHVYRARLYSSEILPEYVSLAAKAKYAKDYFFRNASQTVNLASINITTLGNLPLPIPPLDEQKEVCSRINQLFQIADSVKINHRNLSRHLTQLNQSILAKAFRGELVEQDPNDEPAFVLLDRIRAERQTQEGKKSGGTRGKRKKASSDQLDLPGVE